MRCSKTLIITIVVGLSALTFGVRAANFDGSRPLLCSIAAISECTPETGCQKTTIEEGRHAAISSSGRTEKNYNSCRNG